MSNRRTIPVTEVAIRTKAQLRIFDSAQDDFLQMLIYEGLRHVDALPMLIKKNCKICVSDGKAKLPCDFYKLLAIRGVSLGVVGNQNLYTDRVYVDRNFLRDEGVECGDEVQDYSSAFQINGGYIYLGYGGEETEEIHLAYLGLNEDADGNLLIYEDYERALTNYACYMFMMAFNENYNQYLIDRHNRTWVAQKNWLRGEAARLDFEKTKYQIRLTFNAIAIDPIMYQIFTDL